MSKYIKEDEDKANNSYLSSSSKYNSKQKSKYQWDDGETLATVNGKKSSNAEDESNIVLAMPAVPVHIKREKSKGEVTSLKNFNSVDYSSKTQSSKSHHHRKYLTKEEKKAEKIKAITFMLALLLASICLELVRIELPFMPSFLTIDFSVFPEFVSVVFFGPVVGIATVVFKNLAHMLFFWAIHGNISYVGELSNLINDTVFIIIAFFIYVALAGKLPIRSQTKRKRIFGVLLSGTGSALATSLIMIPVMKWIIYPLYVKYFSAYGHTVDFLTYYTEKLPSISNLWQGMLIFNLPWDFGKLFIVSIFATITYWLVTKREHK